MRSGTKHPRIHIDFTRTELIHIRRFLNRAVECSEGRCPGYEVSAWYYLEPVLKKIQRAMKDTGT